jgi:hypothetical protein
MELTPELAKTLADFALEKKGLIPKKKYIKSIKIKTKTITNKDGNTILESSSVSYR